MAIATPRQNHSTSMYVGGTWTAARGDATIDCVNPATEDILGQVPDAGEQDVDAAVRAAAEASEEWRDLPWQSRAMALRDFAERIDEHQDELAMLDTLDSGNPISSMRSDVASTGNEIRYYAGIASEIKGITVPTVADTLSLTERVAYPVVGRIVPFNHPFKFAAGKAAAPLAAGCAIVIKPGEQT